MTVSAAVILGVFLLIFLKKAVVIVPEGSVDLDFVLGKYMGGRAAGLHFVLPGSGAKRLRLKIGRTGTASSEEHAEFGDYQVPMKYSGLMQIGKPVRIKDFDGLIPVVTHEGVPESRSFKCEKCGHSNTI